MENTDTFKDFLDKKEFKNHQKDLTLQDFKTEVDLFLGTSIHKLKSFKNGRLDKFNADYSDSEHIATGKMTIRGAVLSAIYSGLSINTGLFGSTKPVIDLSKDSLTKAIENYNDFAEKSTKAATEHAEILQYFSDTLLTSPDLAAYAFQIAVASGTLITGIYVKNGLKRNVDIENICKDVDKKVKHKNFSLGHASDIFKVLDSFYEYRRMAAIAGKNTKQFVKDIAAPVLYALKHNVSNPILEQIKDIIGEDKINKVTNGLKKLTPKMITNMFSDKTITPSDMILYIDKKIKNSILNDDTNNPVKLNMQEELSKVSKDVYETMMLTQTRRALIKATKDYIDSQKNIITLKEEGGIINSFKIKNEEKNSKKQLDLIKSIEQLSKLDQKDNRISRYTVVSSTAHKVLRKISLLNEDKIKDLNNSLKDVSKVINNNIYKSENEIKEVYLSLDENNNFYIQDIDKMMMPKTYSFERIFKEKVDEMVADKTKEITQKREETRNKLKNS